MSLRQNSVEQHRTELVAGAAADTDIAVADILKEDDILISVVNLSDLDMPAGCTITEDGVIQSTDITTGDVLMVTWGDMSRG